MDANEQARIDAAKAFAAGQRDQSVWGGFGPYWSAYLVEFDGVPLYVQARVFEDASASIGASVDEWRIYAGGVEISNLIADGSLAWNAIESDILNQAFQREQE